MGNSCRQCCRREQEETIEIPMADLQETHKGKEVVLILPKIIVVDENDQEYEIYNPETNPQSEAKRGARVKKPPIRRGPSRRRLMLVKPPPDEEEAGPSGIQQRRRSSYTGKMLSPSSALGGIPSSSIVHDDPFVIIANQHRARLKKNIDMTRDNTERLRQLVTYFTPGCPGTPNEVMFWPETPMETYHFLALKETCYRERVRRRSWW